MNVYVVGYPLIKPSAALQRDSAILYLFTAQNSVRFQDAQPLLPVQCLFACLVHTMMEFQFIENTLKKMLPFSSSDERDILDTIEKFGHRLENSDDVKSELSLIAQELTAHLDYCHAAAAIIAEVLLNGQHAATKNTQNVLHKIVAAAGCMNDNDNGRSIVLDSSQCNEKTSLGAGDEGHGDKVLDKVEDARIKRRNR